MAIEKNRRNVKTGSISGGSWLCGWRAETAAAIRREAMVAGNDQRYRLNRLAAGGNRRRRQLRWRRRQPALPARSIGGGRQMSAK